MKLAIVGSRNFKNLMRVAHYVCHLPLDTVIVSGGARGVDETAAVNARRRGMDVIVHLPDWDTHGKAAGFVRNQRIVDDADAVVAFWNGSNGTLDTIRKANQAGKVVKIYPDLPMDKED